ncbi:MAG: family 16 glycosylhydrolase [Hallerella succinigenes]|nr:family 16 glycosylhydrolase [Hallerella succinigenes]MDD6091037.1 family 16 glycosylhydrolase [Hallerella succinigenes]
MTMKFKKVLFMLGLGLLSSTAVAQDKDYSGAELFTNETQMYGKYEARMMMATGSGLVSSMFLYHNDSYMGDPEPWVEVDIEILGKVPNKFQSNIITGNAAKQITSEKHHDLPGNANEGYHTYGMEWTPNYVAWFIDGVQVRKTMTDSNDTKNQVAALIREQGLRFNLWSSEVTSWVGEWNDAILPVHQYINWVKVYTYTPGAGENGSDFTLAWTDDFDTFDDSRWGAGNWTFDKNRVTMSPDNVTVKDGTLILSLTKAGQEGFTGVVPVDTDNTAIRKSKSVKSVGASYPEYLSTFDLIGRYKGEKKR